MSPETGLNAKLLQAPVRGRGRLGVVVSLYVVSGVCQPLLSSQLNYSGLGDRVAQLYMVPYFGGAALVGVLYFCLPSRRWCAYKVQRSCGIALIDLTGQTLNYTGNNLAGSAVFAVIYASVSIWCAVFSRCLGLRRLTWPQWAAVFWVFGGLGFSALDSVVAGSRVCLGASMVAVGALLHASTYVLSEFVLVRGQEEAIPPHINCATMSSVSTAVFGLWQCFYTIPRWDETIARDMEAAGTSSSEAVLLLTLVAAANFVHAASFFFLLKWIGSVSAAVLKGLQAVLVFIAADPLFCSSHSEQCTDTYKWISLVLVVSGVLAYASVTSS